MLGVQRQAGEGLMGFIGFIGGIVGAALILAIFFWKDRPKKPPTMDEYL